MVLGRFVIFFVIKCILNTVMICIKNEVINKAIIKSNLHNTIVNKDEDLEQTVKDLLRSVLTQLYQVYFCERALRQRFGLSSRQVQPTSTPKFA